MKYGTSWVLVFLCLPLFYVLVKTPSVNCSKFTWITPFGANSNDTIIIPWSVCWWLQLWQLLQQLCLLWQQTWPIGGERDSLTRWVFEVHAVSGQSTNPLALQAARRKHPCNQNCEGGCSYCAVSFKSVDKVQTFAMLHKRPCPCPKRTGHSQ